MKIAVRAMHVLLMRARFSRLEIRKKFAPRDPDRCDSGVEYDLIVTQSFDCISIAKGVIGSHKSRLIRYDNARQK